MGAFEQWSAESLGQWHYVLGFLIVLTLHNWPLLLAVGLCLWWGASLYRSPTRARVARFYGALLLGVAYEYAKHVAATLHGSIDTITNTEILWLNGAAHVLAGPVMQTLLFVTMAFFLIQGLWLEARARATQRPGARPVAGHQEEA